MNKQMTQLRVGCQAGGHDGATGVLDLPEHATLRPADKTVFGLCVLAIPTGLRVDDPADQRLHDAPLRHIGRVEDTEVQ